MSLQFITSKILPVYATFTGAVMMAEGSITDGMVIWAFRGFVALCLGIIAYFLKKMVDDSKAADKQRDTDIRDLQKSYTEIVKLTAAHEVMYEFWLENITNNAHPEEGTRKTDQLHRVIQRLAEEKQR